jgi:RNA polymerase sigma-70 factor (ECF subfamily)
MPPFIGWYQGPENIAQLIDTHCPGRPGDFQLVETVANGQPALGLYIRGDDDVHRPFNLQVLSLTAAGVSHTTAFFDVQLFDTFGLPKTITVARRTD